MAAVEAASDPHPGRRRAGRVCPRAATAIRELIDSALAARGECALALCGGKTPAPVYTELARYPIDWRRVTIWFGDERAVPPDAADSNYEMARRSLLARAPIPPANVHRMAAERRDADVAAREYESALPVHLDLLLLGIGPDGHTASIFPGSPASRENIRRVMAVASPPAPLMPQVARMTITPVVIAAARNVVVMVQGRDKATMVQRILEGPEQPTVLPAQYARGGTWIVDQAAASELQSRDS